MSGPLSGTAPADRVVVSIVTAEKVTNVGPRFEWYPLAVRDDAFFHALMSSTASHVAHNRRVPTPGTYYHHRGIAIRMINERLERGAHDEGTINTVVIFALQEVGGLSYTVGVC